MKKITALLITAFLLSAPAYAGAPAQAAAFPVTRAEVPLTGQIALFDAAGKQLGEIGQQGLLLVSGTPEDVVSLNVIQGGEGRGVVYRLVQPQQGVLGVECFGPNGQRVHLTLPNLKAVTWISSSGRITRLSF